MNGVAAAASAAAPAAAAGAARPATAAAPAAKPAPAPPAASAPSSVGATCDASATRRVSFSAPRGVGPADAAAVAAALAIASTAAAEASPYLSRASFAAPGGARVVAVEKALAAGFVAPFVPRKHPELDPHEYAVLPPAWTSTIRPAGFPIKRGGTAREAFMMFA